MSVESGFDALQTTVNVDADDLTEARRRRDVFRTELIMGKPTAALAEPTGCFE